MPNHRIAKRANQTLLARAGASPNTVGMVFNDQRFAATATESQLVMSVDGTNLRILEDGHMGAAAESNVGTSYIIASQQQVAAGNGNGADTTDDVLFTFALPANALNAAGKGCEIEAWGTTTAAATNKIAKIWWGTTTQTVGAVVAGGVALVSSGNIGNGSAVAWYAFGQVVKTASNIQISFAAVYAGTAVSAQTVTTNLAATDTAAINITITGSNSAATANGIVCNSFSVCFQN